MAWAILAAFDHAFAVIRQSGIVVVVDRNRANRADMNDVRLVLGRKTSHLDSLTGPAQNVLSRVCGG